MQNNVKVLLYCWDVVHVLDHNQDISWLDVEIFNTYDIALVSIPQAFMDQNYRFARRRLFDSDSGFSCGETPYTSQGDLFEYLQFPLFTYPRSFWILETVHAFICTHVLLIKRKLSLFLNNMMYSYTLITGHPWMWLLHLHLIE